MGMISKIETALNEAFSPKTLVVVDDSEKHRGHAGYQEGGESHFHVTIVAKEFSGMSRIARHRAVHTALGKEILDSIHALALDISTGD